MRTPQETMAFMARESRLNNDKSAKAPKRVHDALDAYWAAQKAFKAAKEEHPRDVDKVARLAKENKAASDRFEQLLNGRN